MNDNTLKLLEQLAAKLGTTSEYLWSILIKQAPISASINLLLCAFIMVYNVVWIKLHLKFMNDDNDLSYDNKEGFLTVPMGIGGVAGALFIFLFLALLKSAIYGFFNPEYWALTYILDHIK